MWAIRVFLVMALAFGLSACGSKFKTYRGPEVTRIEVHKTDRKMYMLHNTEVLKTYDISLGFAPQGHKQFKNDGKTPEGVYYIDRRNPNSEYHLSLGMSYPNQTDREFAASHDKSPGGDIFIHGNTGKNGRRGDWTAGCIAVKDREMEDIYAMVSTGTQIVVYP